jgi:hypothetical protein
MIRASSSLCGALFLAAGLCGAASPASADAANLLGAFGNWTAYSTGTGSAMTCYAMSNPRAMQPKTAKRNQKAIYLMFSDWPGRKIKAEAEIVPNYEYKANAPVTLEIGADRFAFFSRNEAKSGTAWLQSLNDGSHLLDVMSHGVVAQALGTSAKGTRTADTYSLSGFSDAIAKIHAVCGM